MATPEQRSRAARIAANVQWAKTPNWSERTEAARRASPMSLDYWIARIRAEGKVREQDIVKAAEHYYTAHMTQMSLRAVAARRRKTADAKRNLRS